MRPLDKSQPADRPSWLATAYFATFLLSVAMCMWRFETAEVMLLCVSVFVQILHYVASER